jgi:hypothetical protein
MDVDRSFTEFGHWNGPSAVRQSGLLPQQSFADIGCNCNRTQ